MRIIRRGLLRIAVIDPAKKFGEPGQYVAYDTAKNPKLNAAAIMVAAWCERKEVRYYYHEMLTGGDEPVPAKLIITEIPPGHVQPFHTHLDVHEVTTVVEGELIAIESPDLTEEDWVTIAAKGEILQPGDSVVEDPGVRHTVMNRDPERYCVISTLQVGRVLTPERFESDWVREEPQAKEAEEVPAVRAQATV